MTHATGGIKRLSKIIDIECERVDHFMFARRLVELWRAPPLRLDVIRVYRRAGTTSGAPKGALEINEIILYKRHLTSWNLAERFKTIRTEEGSKMISVRTDVSVIHHDVTSS